ncbi:MAG: DVU_1551 family NTP transferase [Bacillota bacterium]|jgi:molybdenum cofactor cytidylyltransferase
MKKQGRIIAIILAAGYSSRMGGFKPLLQVGKHTVIEKVVDSFFQAGINDVRIVVGYRANEIIYALSHKKIRFIINSRFSQGMFSSVQTGVDSIEDDVEAFFLLPADHPLITPEVIGKLLEIQLKTGAKIIYPCYKKVRGHPPLISTSLKKSILAWEQTGGLRALLGKKEEEALDVEIEDRGILIDMDTPYDYRKILKYNAEKNAEKIVPTREDCYRILEEHRVAEQVLNHGKAVAQVAKKIVLLLNAQGLELNIDMIEAGALLHDLAKGRHDHAKEAKEILQNMGYRQLGEIVGTHMDITINDTDQPDEAEIIYLADKLVKGEQVVSIDQRFSFSLIKYAKNLEIFSQVKKRQEDAFTIKAKVEKILGLPLESIISLSEQ